MSDFRKGLLYTAAPIVGLSVFSMIRFFAVGSVWLWLIAASGILIALVVAIINAARGKRSLAAGIFAGIGIGIVSLGATCFANISLGYQF